LVLYTAQAQALLDYRGNGTPLPRRRFFQGTVQIVIQGNSQTTHAKASLDLTRDSVAQKHQYTTFLNLEMVRRNSDVSTCGGIDAL
jgi:hypothetical protein